MPACGTHDRVVSAAAAMALAQRYHSTEGVRSLSIEERQYLTYHEHLICTTHGDYSRKTMKKMGDIIRSESRSELGTTSYTSLATGHLHRRSPFRRPRRSNRFRPQASRCRRRCGGRRSTR